jgi:hypothetical protein
MRLAVAHDLAGYPRFFNGRYARTRSAGGFARPKTSAVPDKARVYEDRVVAQLMADFFNVAYGVRTHSLRRPWIVAELPEAWTS